MELIWRATNLALASQYLPLYENLIRRLGGGREVLLRPPCVDMHGVISTLKGIRASPSSPDTMIEHVMHYAIIFAICGGLTTRNLILMANPTSVFVPRPSIRPSSRFFSSGHIYDQGTGTGPYRNKKIACSLVILLSSNS